MQLYWTFCYNELIEPYGMQRVGTSYDMQRVSTAYGMQRVSTLRVFVFKSRLLNRFF
jgi:hypothetical protein